MNLLIIWLIVSVVCTGLVLVGIKFAPRIDDEPMNIMDRPTMRFDDPVAQGNRHLLKRRLRGEFRPLFSRKFGRRHLFRKPVTEFIVNRPEERQS